MRMAILAGALCVAACNKTGDQPPQPTLTSAPVAASTADNTKVNERDRNDTLTPMNQGNGSDEVSITASIRRNLVSDKTLSFDAQNVKVITIGSKVTLRGPVKTDQEKATIEKIAKQTPGVAEVDEQLDVKK